MECPQSETLRGRTAAPLRRNELGTRQWLRFGVVHARHHLVIVADVLASVAPKAKMPELAPIEPVP